MRFDPLDTCYSFVGIDSADEERNEPEVIDTDFECVHLSGFLTSRHRNIISDGRERLQDNLLVPEARESIGEWMGVFSDGKGNYLVLGDQFGYQPIYYRPITDRHGKFVLIVGTSVGAIASEASRLGAKSKLDAVEFAAATESDHAWTITQQSTNTFEASTRVLLPGQLIHISRSGWYIDRRTIFDSENLTYEECLGRAIDRALDHTRVGMSLPVDQKRINLSGGRDSRMVIALLAASDSLDDLTVTSMNPETWTPKSARPLLYRDLHISNSIREHYGLSWTTQFNTEYIPLDFYSSLDFWQSYRSHKNYRFRAQKDVYLQSGTNIEFRGAAGETFRGFDAVAGLLASSQINGTQEALDSDTKAIVETLYPDASIEKDLLTTFTERLRALFDELGATHIDQALHYRYSVFRNRSHFGHTKASMAQNQVPVLPLSQPEFIWARDRLSAQEITSGKIAFDIIEHLQPDLNTLQFDDGPWKPSPHLQGGSRRTWTVHESRDHYQDFFDAEESAVAQRVKKRSQLEPHLASLSQFDGRQMAINELKGLLPELAAVDETGYLNARKRRQIFQSIEGKRMNPLVLLSKAMSARDAIAGRGNEAAIRFSYISEQRNLFSIDGTAAGESTRRIVGQPQFQLPISVSTKSVTANVRVWGEVARPLEFRFRLVSEAGTVASTSFSTDNSVEFVLPTVSGKYRIQGMVQYEGSNEVPFKFYSKYFMV